MATNSGGSPVSAEGNAPCRSRLLGGLIVFAYRSLIVGSYLLLGGILLALLLPAVTRSRNYSRRAECRNHFKQIGLALHNYAQEYGAFPPACTVGPNGTPLHSWRTLILPYLGQRALYDSIDLTKSWDDEVNAEAGKTWLAVYCCASAHQPPANHSCYLACVTPNGCFQSTASRSLLEITDKLSETLMAIEVPHDLTVPWMSPNDANEGLLLSIGPESKLPHAGGVHGLFSDGGVRFLPATLTAAARRALLSIGGGEEIEEF